MFPICIQSPQALLQHIRCEPHKQCPHDFKMGLPLLPFCIVCSVDGFFFNCDHFNCLVQFQPLLSSVGCQNPCNLLPLRLWQHPFRASTLCTCLHNHILVVPVAYRTVAPPVRTVLLIALSKRPLSTNSAINFSAAGVLT